MGTGPFKFVEYVKGSHWVGKKNPGLLGQGQALPRRLPRRSSSPRRRPRWRRSAASAPTSSSAASAPRSVTALVQALGNKITVQESPWDCVNLVSSTTRRSLSTTSGCGGPHPRPRPLRGLQGAVEDHAGQGRGGHPGARHARTRPRRRSWRSSRATGKTSPPTGPRPSACCKRGGVPDGFSFTFKNRGIPHPYEPLGIWLIDQWRQIGLNVKQETIEPAAYYPMLKRGDFDVAMDFQCGFIVEPDLDLLQFIGTSDANYGRLQGQDDRRSLQEAGARHRLGGAQEVSPRLREAAPGRGSTLIYTLQWHRIIPHCAKSMAGPSPPATT